MADGFILVEAQAMRQLLLALVGPDHHIRELQATRSLHKLGHPNPIDTLLANFDAAQKPVNASVLPADAERTTPDSLAAVGVAPGTGARFPREQPLSQRLLNDALALEVALQNMPDPSALAWLERGLALLWAVLPMVIHEESAGRLIGLDALTLESLDRYASGAVDGKGSDGAWAGHNLLLALERLPGYVHRSKRSAGESIHPITYEKFAFVIAQWPSLQNQRGEAAWRANAMDPMHEVAG